MLRIASATSCGSASSDTRDVSSEVVKTGRSRLTSCLSRATAPRPLEHFTSQPSRHSVLAIDDPLHHSQKGPGTPAAVAAEAVPDILGGVHREVRPRLRRVNRVSSPEPATCLRQPKPADQVEDRERLCSAMFPSFILLSC